MLSQIIYSSAATVPFSEAALTVLLGRARTNNARLDVTGMLLYHEGSFLQVVEGMAPVLETLFAKIGQDKRHNRIMTLLKREVDERHFGDWAMGFASPKHLPANIPGYSDYMRLRGQAAESANAADKVLAAFRDGRFRAYVTA
jgi:Sensors of blue-light using FAD